MTLYLTFLFFKRCASVRALQIYRANIETISEEFSFGKKCVGKYPVIHVFRCVCACAYVWTCVRASCSNSRRIVLNKTDMNLFPGHWREWVRGGGRGMEKEMLFSHWVYEHVVCACAQGGLST